MMPLFDARERTRARHVLRKIRCRAFSARSVICCLPQRYAAAATQPHALCRRTRVRRVDAPARRKARWMPIRRHHGAAGAFVESIAPLLMPHAAARVLNDNVFT